MMRTDTARRFVPFLFFLFLLSSCTSSIPSSRREATPPRAVPRKILIPKGWVDVTSKAPSSAIIFWLVKNDRSASMVLQELKVLTSDKEAFDEEDVCVFGNISLHNKLSKREAERRVTRSPSAERNGKLCEYVYAEGALLRRVLVFRTRTSLFELELKQASERDPLESAADVQTGLAMSYMEQ